MSANLKFRGPYTPGSANLKFGATDGGDDDILNDVVTLPPPIGTTQLQTPTLMYGAGVLTGLRPLGTSILRYDNAVSRGPRNQLHSQWETGDQLAKPVQNLHKDAKHLPTPNAIPFVEAAHLGFSTRASYADAIKTHRYAKSPWEAGTSVPHEIQQVHQEGRAVRPLLVPMWQEGDYLGFAVVMPHQDGKDLRPEVIQIHQEGRNHRKDFKGMWRRVGTRVTKQEKTPWGEGIAPPPGTSVITTPPPTPTPAPTPCYTPPSANDLLLAFSELWDGGSPAIIFRCPTIIPPIGPIIVPVRSVYIVINSFSLKRVSDNIPVTITAASITADYQSWTWGFSGTIPASQYEKVSPLVNGGPVDVEATINGVAFRFLIEDMTEDRSFGSDRYTIRGRSRTAKLDLPFAGKRSYVQDNDYTAVQLAQLELDRTDVETGFSLDWDLATALGWDVPNGAWSYAEQSPIEAIKAIVDAGGGFIQSHTTNKQLIVRSRFPLAPWEFGTATPDIVLPHSVATSKGWRLDLSPEYNGVYTIGQTMGVEAFVKRTGTAGDLQAATFLNQLITDPAVAREKGRVILSEAGRRAYLDYSVPLSDDVPLLKPGLLMEITDGGTSEEPAWRGYLRANTISAQWTDTLKVRQAIQIERRYL